MNINQAIIELYRFTKLNKGLLSYADIAKIFGCTRSHPAKMAKEGRELNKDQIIQLERRFNFSFFDRESATKRLEAISKFKPLYIGDYEEFSLYDLQELVKVHNVNLNYLLCGEGEMFIDEENKTLPPDLKDLVRQEVSEVLKIRGF